MTPSPPVEHHGPQHAELGKINPVPPQPAIPYTLGQTPKQQERVLMVGVVLWLVIAVVVLKSYIF